MTAVAVRFGITWPMPAVVKEADDRVLLAEARDFMGNPDWSRVQARAGGLIPWPDDRRICPLGADSAREAFLMHFEIWQRRRGGAS